MYRFGMVSMLLASLWPIGLPTAAQDGPGNLAANPGFERDDDGNGFPDDWHAGRAKGAASLSPDAHSGRFSLLYASPTPHDWRKDAAPDTWDFSAWRADREKPDSRFYYAVPVVSKEFRIEYPKVYRVSAWVKAENVSGLHVKFIGIPPGGAPQWFPPGLRTPEGFTGKTGSWDWERWETFIIANRGKGWQGRVEVWMRENVTDGRFWIDDVAVEEVDHAGCGLHPPPTGAAPLPDRATLPAAATLRKQTVKEEKDAVEIAFANGTAITFNKESADGGLGIGDVVVNGKRLRRSIPPIRPLIETESGGRYDTCRYVRCEPAGETVVVKTELVEKDTGCVDGLDWVLAPTTLRVYERDYVGFRYAYRFTSGENLATGIWDRATWELDGRVDGLCVKAPGDPRATPLTTAMGLELSPCIPFLRTPCFDFQARSGDGIVLGYFDDVDHIETWTEKRTGEDRLHHIAHHYLTSAKEVQTVPRCVVFSACGPLAPLGVEDEHTWALDAIERECRDIVGLKEIPLLPSVRLHPSGTDGGKFENYIRLLPGVKELGVQVVMLNPIWESLDHDGNPKPGTCSIIGLEVAKAFGGEAGLKKLGDAVHASGMKLITWAPTALNRHDSALLHDHPDWICRLPDGKPRTYGSPGSYAPGRELTYVSLASGYLDYSLERYRHFREHIGLNGFWQDSFHAAGQLHYTSPTRSVGYLKTAFKRQAQLQQMGYDILNIEGYGPFGNDSPSPRMLMVGDRQEYKICVYYYLGLGPDTYYRCVANKGMPILPYQDGPHPYWVNRSAANNPHLRAEVAQANRDYMTVRSAMGRRFLIPSAADPRQEIGVLWRSDDAAQEALFAYGAFDWRVGEGRSVTDVTTGQAAPLADGVLHAQPKHTYLIVNKR